MRPIPARSPRRLPTARPRRRSGAAAETRSTTCCSGAGTSSTRRAGRAPSATWRSPGGKIAAVAARIDPAEAFKVVDVSGLYVTPGLVDMHVHVYAGTGEKGSYAGDNSLYPDGFTLRVGRHHGGGRGLRRLAELRGLQGPRHRPLPHARPGLPQHRRATACGEGSTSRTSRTWRRSPRPRWRSGTRA